MSTEHFQEKDLKFNIMAYFLLGAFAKNSTIPTKFINLFIAFAVWAFPFSFLFIKYFQPLGHGLMIETEQLSSNLLPLILYFSRVARFLTKWQPVATE